jgi:acetoacetyl-CoA synthetase
MTHQIERYMAWLRTHSDDGLAFDHYQDLWQWSVDHPALFWESLVRYFDLNWTYDTVLKGEMPRAQWFEGATLNYAQEIFRRAQHHHPAILFASEHRPYAEISWTNLEHQTAVVARYLRQCGVERGDRVAAYLPNCPEATIALLATLSVGAVWSSASPDFGPESVVERMAQIEPKVLFAVQGYSYGGKWFDRTPAVRSLQEQLPSLQQVVLFDNYPPAGITTEPLPHCTPWGVLFQDDTGATLPLVFEQVPFAHPIWILFSSGTTGMPKAITHGHGGMLLEHLKYLTFHNDVQPGERFFWFTTTGWMMWNFTHAALLAGATIVLYDGSPAYPDLYRLWHLAGDLKINHFGIGAAFVLSCMKAGVSLSPNALPDLRCIGSTGSPLPPEGFTWIDQQVKPGVWLSSMSGGTDVCTAWVGGNPLLPVVQGEIQCRCLGCAMESFDEDGIAVVGKVGEMVVTKPMPCMPVFFWADPDGSKYFNSYFDTFPGVWRHGDWLLVTERNTLVILGRSDATLNRQGVRIGTSEIYRSVEKLPEIADSLVVDIEQFGGHSKMILFVVPAPATALDDALKAKIARTLRTDFSPRHVPDEIVAVPEIPYTISGKKMELPVKKILMGKPLAQAANAGAMRNPGALEYFRP